MKENKDVIKVIEICLVLGIVLLFFWPAGILLYKYYGKQDKKNLLLTQKVLKVIGGVHLFLSTTQLSKQSTIGIVVILFIVGYIQIRKGITDEKAMKITKEKVPFLGYGIWVVALLISIYNVSYVESFIEDVYVTEQGSAIECAYNMIGGFIILHIGFQLQKKEMQFRQYLTCVLQQGITSINQISSLVHNTPSDVVSVLNEMIQSQYFGNAYIDPVRQLLVFPNRQNANTVSQNYTNRTAPVKTEIVICKNCGGNTTVVIGRTCECEFCGSPISK